MFNILPFLIIGASVVVIVYIIVRKLPEISTLDVNAIPKERDKQVKNKILDERLVRSLKERAGVAATVAQKVGKGTVQYGKKAYSFLQRLEVKYKHEAAKRKDAKREEQLQYEHAEAAMKEKPLFKNTVQPEPISEKDDTEPSASDSSETLVSEVSENVAEQLARAAEYVKNEELKDAERLYLQVISLEPQNVEAYRGLAAVYVFQKEIQLAIDTYRHVLKLKDDEAELHYELSEVLNIADKPMEAYATVLKARQLEPNNPRYVDAQIRLALQLKNAVDAADAIELLAELNPENAKIVAYREKLSLL